MTQTVRLIVWGDYASFNRPEMKVERVSYEVMTPSAARGVLDAVYWKPQMYWHVDKIHVLRPIRVTHVRRNEISATIPVGGAAGVRAAVRGKVKRMGITVSDHRQQRAGLILKDVAYGIEARPIVLDATAPDGAVLANAARKHAAVFERRASRGQCFHRPYLGTREFPAHFKLASEFPDPPEELRGTRVLGRMLHDLEYTEDPKGPIIESSRGCRLRATPRFFDATLHDGVLTIPRATWRGVTP